MTQQQSPQQTPQQNGVRSNWPTIGELRAVGQPESVRSRAMSEHWVADLYLRRLSPYLTRILLRLGFSANGVTWLMIITAFVAALVTAVPGVVSALIVVVLIQLQMLIDCSDGEVARWRGTSSPKGVYLDRVGHYVAECGIAVALGVRVGGVSLYSPWIAAGLALALLVCLNKVENDLVHVSRHYLGMERLVDSHAVRVPRRGVIRVARQIARFVPFHRVFHSVELSFLILVAALLDLVLGGRATPVLLLALLVAAGVTVVGHLAAVLASPRLR